MREFVRVTLRGVRQLFAWLGDIVIASEANKSAPLQSTWVASVMSSCTASSALAALVRHVCCRQFQVRAIAIWLPSMAQNLQHFVCLSFVFLREAISFAVAITRFWHSELPESHYTVCLHLDDL